MRARPSTYRVHGRTWTQSTLGTVDDVLCGEIGQILWALIDDRIVIRIRCIRIRARKRGECSA